MNIHEIFRFIHNNDNYLGTYLNKAKSFSEIWCYCCFKIKMLLWF